jgi:hypothetical protein
MGSPDAAAFGQDGVAFARSSTPQCHWNSSGLTFQTSPEPRMGQTLGYSLGERSNAANLSKSSSMKLAFELV